jgi:RNA polymerase sigma-70 factor (ECF subfamily)
MPTDDELVAAKLAGDPEAFATLVGRYGGMVRAVALRTLGPGHAGVDDAAQVAWLRAYRHLPRYDGRGRFGGWLRTIAANAADDQRRRDRFAGAVVDLLPERPDPRPGPDAEALRRELGEALARALATLPPDQRDAVLLCDRDGARNTEAAAILGIPAATVATRLHRGRGRLRGLLGTV